MSESYSKLQKNWKKRKYIGHDGLEKRNRDGGIGQIDSCFQVSIEILLLYNNLIMQQRGKSEYYAFNQFFVVC